MPARPGSSSAPGTRWGRWRGEGCPEVESAGGDLPGGEEGGAEDEPLLRALLAAYPDRVARRREPRSPRGVMVGGRGVRLAEESAVLEAPLFLCVDLDAGRAGPLAEALVRKASAVEPEWLP